MKTNYKMIMELDNKCRRQDVSCLPGGKTRQIREMLCIEEMDALQLRNLRDMATMYFYYKLDGVGSVRERMHMLAAIEGMIEDRLQRIGAEV